MGTRRLVVSIFALLALGMAGTVLAAAVSVEGTVEDPSEGLVSGAVVEIRLPDGSWQRETISSNIGSFRFDGVEEGDYILNVRRAGFVTAEMPITVNASATSITVKLEIPVFVQEVVVTSSMPEMVNESEVEGRRLEEEVAQDTGEFLRELPETYSVRRGAINMDPTLRGLQENQLALFVDGTRTFAAGPARMDSDISHVGPHAIQSIRIVKGPYALAWGAGTMSAIRLETIRPNFRSGGFQPGGRLGYNFGQNGSLSDGYATVWGAGERARFTLSAGSRVGNDYTDGDGNEIPGDYKSFDTRWDFGFLATPNTTIEYSGGYQEQRDIDYPGRILDATYFNTLSQALEVTWDRAGAGQFYAQWFANLKDHLMNNDNKPTAQDMPGRVPPFGLRVDLPTSSDTYGGRAFYTRDAGDVTWKAGFDYYDSHQSASRSIYRRADDRLLFEDIVWPDGAIRDIGAYGQAVYAKGRGQLGATLRIDGVDASSGELSEFFVANTMGDPNQTEANWSGAVNATYRVADSWLVSGGFGRTVRTASVMERYSDRFPATKFQNAAEFLGNPLLAPEVSLEWDAGISASLKGGASFGFDTYGRRIKDYITVALDGDVPKRLPLSPDTVYRYVNGNARFFGYEAYGSSPVGNHLRLRGSLQYVWAEDETFDEPAYGIPPLEFHVAAKVQTENADRWAELELTATAAQDRVAVARLEKPTEGWNRLDLRAGIALVRGLGLRLGLLNITNEQYVTHLNAMSPFLGVRIPEPGRSFYIGADFDF